MTGSRTPIGGGHALAGLPAARTPRRSYQALRDAAIRHHADRVLVTSFNDCREGSEIEPPGEHGDRYLHLTAAASRRFRAA